MHIDNYLECKWVKCTSQKTGWADENFPNMGKQIANQVQEAESFGQDTPKEEHTETDSNQKWWKLETKTKY